MNNNWAIKKAVTKGYLETVRVLLKDERIFSSYNCYQLVQKTKKSQKKQLHRSV